MSETPSQPKRMKVLLVDDERAVRRVGERALKQGGFDVLTAENGNDALRVFHAHQGEIGLVILDMSMPEMSGVETFTELRRVDLLVQVVLSSGYDSQETAERLAALNPAGYIQKPYRVTTLLDTVRELLSEA
jgi:DNA-binding NtrC family response regulator